MYSRMTRHKLFSYVTSSANCYCSAEPLTRIPDQTAAPHSPGRPDIHFTLATLLLRISTAGMEATATPPSLRRLHFFISPTDVNRTDNYSATSAIVTQGLPLGKPQQAVVLHLSAHWVSTARPGRVSPAQLHCWSE